MDNSSRFMRHKIALRRGVLARVPNARVLYLFSGRGNMWKHAWSAAPSYLGVDHRTWRSDEPHRRLMTTALNAIDTLDLQQFNVFDVDVYGDPWVIANAILPKRIWSPGEVGAIVFTDGLSGKIRFGDAPRSVHRLTRVHHDLGLRDVTDDYHRAAANEWMKKSNVRPLWGEMFGGGTGRGSSVMWYSAHVFEGLGRQV